MLSRTACGRPGTLSVWETWKPRPGGCPKFRTVGTSMYLYMHDTYWYVLAGVRVYDVGGALAKASAVQGATIRQRRPRPHPCFYIPCLRHFPWSRGFGSNRMYS